MSKVLRREEFISACRARAGLLAVHEPATWHDADGAVQKTPTIRGRLKFGKIPLHSHLRNFVVARDNRCCAICGYTPPAGRDHEWIGEVLRYLDVDHIISRRNGGSHHPGNLQALCNRCNSRKAGLVDRDRPSAGGTQA